MTSTKNSEKVNAIEPNTIYTRRQVMDLLSMGPDAWCSAVRRGLRVARHGQRCYVLGASLLEFLASIEVVTPPQQSKKQARAKR